MSDQIDQDQGRTGRRRDRSPPRWADWLVAVAGAALVIVGALLPWTYTAEYPREPHGRFYPAGPQIYVLVLALVGLVLLLGRTVAAAPTAGRLGDPARHRRRASACWPSGRSRSRSSSWSSS